MTDNNLVPETPLPEYHVDNFPAPGLRQVVRHVTGNTGEGQARFLISDHGEHYRYMVDNRAVANIIYSTRETPVDLNGNVDIVKAREQEVRPCFFSPMCGMWSNRANELVQTSPPSIILVGRSSA